MQRNRGARIVGGILLIGLGLYLLLVQFYPDLRFFESWSWPLIIVGIGALLLVFGMIGGEPGMAVPACIVGGIGLILYYQNETGDWGSWAYAWTLIPGFVGVGTILAGLFGDNPRKAIVDGLTTILFSGVLFVVFSTIFGGPVSLGDYWPVLLIVLGFWILISYFLRGPSKKKRVVVTASTSPEPDSPAGEAPGTDTQTAVDAPVEDSSAESSPGEDEV